MARLRRGLKGRADVRATSARWAWVEYVLAQGGIPEGLALHRAVLAGGRFAHYRKAFEQRPQRTTRRKLYTIRSEPNPDRRQAHRWMDPVPAPDA